MDRTGLRVVRQLSLLWLDSQYNGCQWYIGTKISELDQGLLSIHPPCDISRVLSLVLHKYWKANEWRNWLLFYSPVVLKGILRKQYYKNWLLLVELVYILSSESISEEDLCHCEEVAVHFIILFEELYGKEHVTFNIHLCCHLSDSVRNWGPLWTHSAFVFGSFKLGDTKAVPWNSKSSYSDHAALYISKCSSLTGTHNRE